MQYEERAKTKLMHVPTNGHGGGEASLRCQLEFHGVCCCFEPTTKTKLDQTKFNGKLGLNESPTT
jgi:hypothetical protein